MAYNKPGYFLKTRSIFRISAQICLFVIFRIFGKAYEFQNFCKFFSLCIVFAKKASPHFVEHIEFLENYVTQQLWLSKTRCASVIFITGGMILRSKHIRFISEIS